VYWRHYLADTCLEKDRNTTAADDLIVSNTCHQITNKQYVRASCGAPIGLKKGVGLVTVGYTYGGCEKGTEYTVKYEYSPCLKQENGKYKQTTCNATMVFDTVCDDSDCSQNCKSTGNREHTALLYKCTLPGYSVMCTGYEPMIGDIDTKKFVAQ